jgi:hypothetical protein
METKNVGIEIYGNRKLWQPKTKQRKPMATKNLVTTICGSQNFGN